MVHTNIYTGGYEAAYREIHDIMGDCPCNRDHAPAVIEILMEILAGKLTQDEFYGLAILLEQTGTRIKDLDGTLSIDIWGEMNGCSEEVADV